MESLVITQIHKISNRACDVNQKFCIFCKPRSFGQSKALVEEILIITVYIRQVFK